MTTTTTSPTITTPARPSAAPRFGDVVYRFDGELGPLNPVGLFAEGIRFHNHFAGRIVEGPFAGGRISGPDYFLLRPDGVGEIHAPELIELGDHRIAVDVRGYVTPPVEAPSLPLSALLEPGFQFPDEPFRVTGAAFATTTSPQFTYLNGTTIVVEGTVNMATGVLDVTARTVDRVPVGTTRAT